MRFEQSDPGQEPRERESREQLPQRAAARQGPQAAVCANGGGLAQPSSASSALPALLLPQLPTMCTRSRPSNPCVCRTVVFPHDPANFERAVRLVPPEEEPDGEVLLAMQRPDLIDFFGGNRAIGWKIDLHLRPIREALAAAEAAGEIGRAHV